MKKFLLSLCVLAVAGVCVFMTSCKDDDELQTRVNSNVETAIAAAQDDANYDYQYVLNGQTYTSLEALQNAISELPADSQNEVYVVATNKTTGEVKQGTTSSFTAPQPGQSTTVKIEVPGTTTTTAEVTLNTTLESQHSGGAAK